MAFLVITGGSSRVTSARLGAPEISAAVLSFRIRLVKRGAKIVSTSVGDDGVDVDWLPAGADPELEPIRSSLLWPSMAEAAIEDNEEEIPVEVDAPAIASLEANASSLGVISLDAWRVLRGC